MVGSTTTRSSDRPFRIGDRIEIEELESELEGDIDLRGFLGLSMDLPKGYTDIRANFRVKAKPEDVEKIRELAKFSPVFNTITHGTDVAVNVELK